MTNALGFGQFHGAQQGKVSKSTKSLKGNKGINFVNTHLRQQPTLFKLFNKATGRREL